MLLAFESWSMEDYGGLVDQEIVARVAAQLLHQGTGGPKFIDRNKDPSYGYRALHCVVRVGRMPLEVQVRTAMQDVWATLFERVADAWGRQIRYGCSPDGGAPIR